MRDLEVVSIEGRIQQLSSNADPINVSASALAWLNAYVILTLTSPPAGYLAVPD